ncbi:MAG TPA: hypothetical protein VNW97_01160 [Candidatus Saccharimonadales bacterium]|nr:hypothetical protein [Candidatus Saccharimonadales bacterium]
MSALTAVYVIATIYYAVLSHRMLTAAKNAAQAALLNAQAVIKAERAWICLGEKPFINLRLFPFDGVRSEEIQQVQCDVCIKNFGNTPARITAVKFSLLMGETLVPPDMEKFFSSADYSLTEIIPPCVTSCYKAVLAPMGIISEEQLAELNDGRKILWACGAIKYQDIFETGAENQHETRFCYWRDYKRAIDDPFTEPWGKPEYNRAT